jgi:FMN phosphatase YigB (HAD superfamily)
LRPDPRFELLITDLDNTLYDWEAFFIPSFLAMLGEVERISGVPRDLLETSFRKVYQHHRTTEYAFVLQEADALRKIDAGLTPAEVFAKYDTAIHAFRSARRRTLRLYPGVKSTLTSIRDAGVTLVAHSDSPMEYVSRRLRQLDIDALFDAVSAPRDHGIPPSLAAAPIRQAPDSDVGARTRLIEFNPELRKPDPAALDPLFAAFPANRNRTVYVGDNLSRDVLIAQRAGIKSAWARYGAKHDEVLREQLYRITYWTDADVAAETRLREEAAAHPPTYVLDTFTDLLAVVGLDDRSVV